MSRSLQLNSFMGFVLLASVSVSWAAISNIEVDKGYLYRNCADESVAPPLVECGKLFISNELKNIYIGDRFEEDMPSAADSRYFVLRSKKLPIAIPKDAYERTDSWVYGTTKFIKVKKGVDTFVAGRKVDVIIVVAGVDKTPEILKSNDVNSYAINSNVIATFWYYPERGIEAIGFPSKDGAGGVYYCARQPCLFSQTKR